MDDRLVLAGSAVIGVPLVLVGYISLAETLARGIRGAAQARVRPWLWLAPAAVESFARSWRRRKRGDS